MSKTRKGILAMGNFIVDYVKLIDLWPEQDALAIISNESKSNGGGPYNLLKDLAALGASFPLEACGLIGDDDNGRWIEQDCQKAGINTSQLLVKPHTRTSYTDAMSVKKSGRRTFFHHHGANSHLDATQLELSNSTAKIFYLAYLMLLERLDKLDEYGQTVAGRLLATAQVQGFITVTDCASSTHSDFRAVALAALAHSDIFFANEREVSQILGRTVNADLLSLSAAAKELSAQSPKSLVVLHSDKASCASKASTQELATQNPVKLPQQLIAGATGAGDAFAAGFVYAFHEGQSLADCLITAVCVAAASLTDPRPSDGVTSLETCLDLGNRYGYTQ